MRRVVRSALAVLAAVVLAGCWSQYRAGPAHTGVNESETQLTPTNVAGLHVRWAAQVLTGSQDQLIREPTIVGDTAYVDSLLGRVFAVNVATGATRWSTTIGNGTGTFGAPTIAGGTVYIGAGDGRLYALSTSTGALRWTATVGGNIEAPPTVSGTTIFAASEGPGRLAAIDGRDGTVLWSAPIGDFGLSVAVVADTAFVAFNTQATMTTPLSGSIEAFRATTGESLWTYSTTGFVDGSPAVRDGMVFDTARAPDNSLFALDAGSGALRWRTPGVVGPTGEAGSSVAVAYGRLFFGSAVLGITSFDEATGSLVWSQSGGAVNEPSIANGIVFADRGPLVAYDASSGAVLFTSSALGAGGWNPAVGEGQVLVPVGTTLYDFGL